MGGKFSFVGMTSLYSGKTATTSKASSIVAHPVILVALIFTARYRRFFIDQEYKIGSLLLVFAPNSIGRARKNTTEKENLKKRRKDTFLLADGRFQTGDNKRESQS